MLRVKLKNDDITCIMVSALEGGITYWCKDARVMGEYLGEYASDQIARGGTLLLYAEEDNVWYTLTKEKFISGFMKWLNNGMDTYNAVDKNGNVDTGMIDGNAADSIIQLAIFGEVIYA